MLPPKISQTERLKTTHCPTQSNPTHNKTGARFRSVLGLTTAHSDEACGRALIDRYVCVHLAGHADKQECLLHMLRKLYAFVQGKVRASVGRSVGGCWLFGFVRWCTYMY